MKEENATTKAKAVAAEVFASCRNQVYFQLRYMEHALFYLKPEERMGIRMGSDGRKLYYEVNYLLKRYLQSPDAVACDYLHTVFHCLYQHPLQAKEYDRRYWDLAADIAVADVMGELRLKRMDREISPRCYVITEHLKKEVPLMSAPHIARYLMMEEARLEKLFGMNLQEMREVFARDDHSCWRYRTKKRTEENKEKQEGQTRAGRANARKYRHGNQAAGRISAAGRSTDNKDAVNGEEDKPEEERNEQKEQEEKENT
ncbi:MAG: hypothetical protein LUF30_06190, partial [Lachnospiraceae bacterium]|nr:hypothetical protein [Lachnospiraceae bacterium]